MTTIKATGRLKDRHKARRTPGLVLPLVQEHLLAKLDEDDGRDHSLIHGSEMAKEDWCIRATYWRIKGSPEPKRDYNFVLENILAEGTAIHNKWQTWLQETGKLWGDWECAVCHNRCESEQVSDLEQYGVNPANQVGVHQHIYEYKEISLRHGLIIGHADGAIEDSLIEFKSIGIGTLRAEANDKLQKYYIKSHKCHDLNRLWKEINRPFISHLRQGNIYLWLAEKNSLPFSKMTFVYEYKPFQQVKEFTVTKSDRILKPILERTDKLCVHLDENVPPDCEFGGCKNCKAYEGDNDSTQAQQSAVPARRRKLAGSGEGGRSEAASSRASRGGRAKASARDDGNERRRDHEPVQPVRRVVGLPGNAAQSRSGGRGARKVRGNQA